MLRINIYYYDNDFKQIKVNKKDKSIKLIHPPEHDQFHILREKLNWST